MLSIVVPCYNEAVRLAPLLELIENQAPADWEWIFVDDGSADDTVAQLQSFRARCSRSVQVLVHEANQGKGAAVRSGVLAAQRRCVGYVDADLAASPLDFIPFLERPEILTGQALLLGIRLLTQKRQVHRSPVRHVLGRIYQTYVSTLTGLTVYDAQCGFKLLQTARAQGLFARMECRGFAFDAELILLAAWVYGMEILEVPIAWEEKHHSRVRPWTAARMFVDVLGIRRRCRRAASGRHVEEPS